MYEGGEEEELNRSFNASDLNDSKNNIINYEDDYVTK